MNHQYDQDEDDIKNKLKAIEDKINANHYQVPDEEEEDKKEAGNDMFFPTEIETNYERKETANTKLTADTKSTNKVGTMMKSLQLQQAKNDNNAVVCNQLSLVNKADKYLDMDQKIFENY